MSSVKIKLDFDDVMYSVVNTKLTICHCTNVFLDFVVVVKLIQLKNERNKTSETQPDK